MKKYYVTLQVFKLEHETSYSEDGLDRSKLIEVEFDETKISQPFQMLADTAITRFITENGFSSTRNKYFTIYIFNEKKQLFLKLFSTIDAKSVSRNLIVDNKIFKNVIGIN